MPCEPGNLAMVVCHDDLGLHILFDEPGKWGKVWNQHMLAYPPNVHVDLSVRVVENQWAAGGYGILCRYQNNGDGYVLRVWTDGHYGITRMLGGREYLLGGSGDTPSPAIAAGLAENQLRMECIDDTFAITANGQEVLRVVDDNPELRRGAVALYGCTCRGGTLDVAFSHVRIVAPDPATSTVPPRRAHAVLAQALAR